MREKVRAAHPVQGRPLRRQAQPRRHDGRGVRGAVPGAGAQRPRTRRCSTTSATSRCCSAPRPPACCPPAWATPRPTPTANCAAPSTGRGWTSSPRSSSPSAWPRSATPCWRCGTRCSAERARSERPRLAAVAAGCCAGLAAPRCWPGGPPAPPLDWQPAAGLAPNPGAALTAAFVHWSPLHLGANLAGPALVAASAGPRGVPPRAALAWVAGLAAHPPGAAAPAELLHYGGLSGVLHARRGRRTVLAGAARPGCAARGRLADARRPERQAAGRGALGRRAATRRASWDIAVAPLAHASGAHRRRAVRAAGAAPGSRAALD